MARTGNAIKIEVDGVEVRVSNPDKPMFEGMSVTKRDLVQYYLSVGPGILRALFNRPTTLERWVDGWSSDIATPDRYKKPESAFFQKRVPRGAPEWVRTSRIEFPSGRHADEVAPDHLAVVAWAANLGTLTFHPWAVRATDVDHPDELRIDLDPQPGTDFSDAVQVAHALHELLAEHGITGFPKTSGGRGVHVYVRIEPR